ncbi:hypothetical protein ACQ33O_08235 [Ferruginibacter sp. SUN002]|uniref:hypothetical protein n=1 Tax=Ferruginibacter sp. SUN002 TaxID=2937789 RepID=UPI003D36A9DC
MQNACRALPITLKYTHILAPKRANFQSKMVQEIKLRLVNEKLNIGLVNWKQVYILNPTVNELIPETDRGRLVYRVRGSSRRISYAKIKKGLKRKDLRISVDVPNWF